MTIRISKPAFNLREKISQLEGRVPFERMPVGSVMLIGRRFTSNRTNISSNSTWTNISDCDITVFPRLQSSLLEIEMNFTVESQNAPSGIGFRIWRSRIRSDGLGANTNKIYDNYQHSHWGTGNWTGPGDIVLNWNDSPGVTTPVRYFVQGYRETGNALYINAGSDPLGITMRVLEIKQ